MLHALSVWLLAAAFLAAGSANAVGTAATRASFARWGFPPWWGALTGGLEVACAALLAFPAARPFGLALGAAVVAAAAVTVLRHREWSHLMPLGVFAALLVAATASP